MSILLTGATGFIGSSILEKFIKSGEEVFIIIRRNSNLWRIKDLFKENTIKTIFSDDFVTIENVLEYGKIKAIFHLATKYVKQDDYSHIEDLISSNVTFPTKLLQLAIKYRVKYFINTGTWFEYAIHPILYKDTKKVPYNFYAKTKTIFEDLLIDEVNKGNIQGLTLTLFNPYGPKDNNFKVIPTLIRSALLDVPIKLKNNGESKYGFTYIGDILEAYKNILYMINDKCFINKYENYFIGSSCRNIKTIIATLEGLLNKEIDVIFGNDSDPKSVKFIDISKSKEDLCWEPIMTLRAGLDMTLQYYKGLIK